MEISQTMVVFVGVFSGIGGLIVGGMVAWVWGRFRCSKQQENIKIRVTAISKEKELLEEKIDWQAQSLEKMKETFDALASRALQANSDELIKRSHEQVHAVVQPLNETLTKFAYSVQELEQKREGAYSRLQEQIKQLNTMYVRLQDSTSALVNALKSPTARGRWGELQLRRVVELAGMVEHIDFDEQIGLDGNRPDMLVYLPNQGVLPVDAKVPLDAYLAYTASDSEKERRTLLSQHAKAIRSRIHDLSQKQYWEIFEKSPDFVIMFMPNESFLSVAFDVDADIYEYAMKQRILLTTPVTLLALLKSVAYGWQQVRMAENAQKIALQGQELYKRVGIFADHLLKLQKNLSNTVETYNRVVGSWDHRILPSVRNLKDMGVSDGDISTPTAIDVRPRLLNANESK